MKLIPVVRLRTVPKKFLTFQNLLRFNGLKYSSPERKIYMLRSEELIHFWAPILSDCPILPIYNGTELIHIVYEIIDR